MCGGVKSDVRACVSRLLCCVSLCCAVLCWLCGGALLFNNGATKIRTFWFRKKETRGVPSQDRECTTYLGWSSTTHSRHSSCSTKIGLPAFQQWEGLAISLWWACPAGPERSTQTPTRREFRGCARTLPFDTQVVKTASYAVNAPWSAAHKIHNVSLLLDPD